MDHPSTSNMDPSTSNIRKRGRVNLGISKQGRSVKEASFERRKRGLIKKMRELTILCKAEACFISIPPLKQGIDNGTVEVWPDMAKAREMVDKFRGMSAKDQNKNKNNTKTDSSPNLSQSMNLLKQELASRMIQNINLLKQELAFRRKENKDLQMQLMSPQSLDMLISKMPAKNVETLVRHIDNKLHAVNARVQFLAKQISAPSYHEPASPCGYMGRVNGREGNAGLENGHVNYPPQLPLHQHHYQSLDVPHQPQMHGNGNMNCSWSHGQVNCVPIPY